MSDGNTKQKADALQFGKPELVLLFNCPEAIARERVLGRKQNRMNDTGSMFAKRYAEFAKENPAIAEHYGAEGKLVEVCCPYVAA